MKSETDESRPRSCRGILAVALGAGLIAFGAAPARAQTTSAEQARLFPRVLSAPTDYDNTYAYATASVANRDYEAAIVALERLLYFNPALTRAKYELGTLYFRLKSYPMAIRYFEDALASPGVEADIRERIEIMLPAARKELQPSRFYGVVQLGLGYSNNVPGVPGFGPIRSYGATVLNPGPYYKQGGANLTALGDVLHVYDFQNQRGGLWETRVSGAGAAQFRVRSLSSAFGEISTGPRLALAPDLLPGFTFRPYAVASWGALSAGGTNTTAGGGLSVRTPLGDAASLEAAFEARNLHVGESGYNLLSASLSNSGLLWTASLAGRWSPIDRLTLSARGYVGRNSAAAAATSSRRTGFEASAKYDFDPPFERLGWRWSIAPFVSYVAYRFDAANPYVDPMVLRVDRRMRVGAQLDMPLTANLGVSALIQHERDYSSLPNYRATSWSGMIGPTFRF